MSQPTQFAFSHAEVVEALLKKEGIHEGIWRLTVRFGLKGANMGPSDDNLLPTAIIPVTELGIVRDPKATNLSVDAAQVNPRPRDTKGVAKRRRPRTATKKA